ncbi:hypothetical protein M408DRAFT_20921 [Serendipita vermifera MAFF 305830]|uniref:Uncharacterized protein n=1 Tax=Serendipita vermifera MAFF 305830 TaxID=933852 RepID=A0A0C2X076_SERVB|nr:hypothetical protein M408DRAFT_20921 [Serendipita vermifera MAFF 305830]
MTRRSVTEVLRDAMSSSRLYRVFSGAKPTPASRSASEFKPNGTNAIPDLFYNDGDESGFLIIAPCAQQSPHSATPMEDGMAENVSSNPAAASQQWYTPEEWPGSLPLPIIPPPEDAHDIQGWVKFFSQSHASSSAVTDSASDGTETVRTPIVTESFTSPVDPGTYSSQQYTSTDAFVAGQETETRDELSYIGDDVVLKYILAGMGVIQVPHNELYQGPSESCFKTDKEDTTCNASSAPATVLEKPAVLDIDKALPELRHRKDPSYTELPTISLITATPRTPTPISTLGPPGVIDPHLEAFSTPMHYHRPQFYARVQSPLVPNGGYRQNHQHVAEEPARPQMHVTSTGLVRGPNQSLFFEPDLSITAVAKLAADEGEFNHADNQLAQSQRDPKLSRSIFRKASSTFRDSLLRWRHSTAS